MVASITVTTETSPYPRFGVSLAGWAADGPVTVYRVHPDTTRWPVRAFPDVSGAVSFAYDYESPHNVAVHFEALSTTTLVQSSNVTMPLDGAYLSVPGLPSFAVVVNPVTKPQKVTLGRPRTVIQPWGRRTAVVLGDSRKAGVFSIRIRTYGHAESDALEDVLGQVGTLLLRLPRTRYSWQYVDVGDVDEDAVLDRRALGDPTLTSDPGTWSEWELSCVITDSPVGGIYGDPTASYQALLDTGHTYQNEVTAGRTYLDFIRGVF